MDVEFIKDKLVYLLLSKRVVLPHIFFTENLRISERTIKKWMEQLGKDEYKNYIRIITGNVLNNFLINYPCASEASLLEEVIMISQGGVKSLLKYALLKKKKMCKNDVITLIDSFTKAFAEMCVDNGQTAKIYTCTEEECEDRQYKIDDILNIMNINDSPNTTVVIGDRNKVNAQYKVNENKKSFFVPMWLRVLCWVIFVISICWLALSVWYYYPTTGKVLDFFDSFPWYDWLILFIKVISLIIALYK